MSKPYFAKYLPVEGEIKIGDKFIDTGVMSNGTIIGTRRNKEGVYDYQKVKLFLCSRDIQVGDEYFSPVSNIWDICDNPIMLEQIKEMEKKHKHGRFKIVGEISPEATWVKEGDEFSKDEVDEWWGQAETHIPMIRKLHEKWDAAFLNEKCPIVYKIKGPCGRFH